MNSLPEDVKSQLEEMQGRLSTLETALAPFLNKTPNQLEAQLDPLQRAQMYNTLSQAAASLFKLYLKTKGVDPEDHSFMKEEGRLKQYNKKVGKLAAEVELKKSNRTLEVDVAAMSRFIAAAVPDLSVQQKDELKKIGKEGNSKKKEQKRGQDQGAVEEKAAGGSSKKNKKSTGGSSVGHKDAALKFLHDALGEVKPSK
ncbi:hypothetical protein Ndes2437A_g05019 [Nannochloris sp. 'desiccata']|nr:hypothetical protein KSW81_003053 [Chlorella desiccata (nom. nud.)]